jgi:polar amino acid transport system substrate-binding protein
LQRVTIILDHRGKELTMQRLFRVLAILASVFAVAALATSTAGAARTMSTAKLTFCSDISYPPMESYQGTKAVGLDIDIGTAIAKILHMTPVFKNTVFDSIIPALLTKHCNAILSDMNDTAQRRKQVDFVDYLKTGQSIMVKKGNPKHITTLADLSGKSVSVESGTTNRQFLAAQSAKLVKAGKKGISIKTFPKDTDAAAALKAGKVDAYFSDAPVVVYYVSKDRSFAIGGAPISPIPVGIAIRKHEPLKAKVQNAINTLYSNGTMKKIVSKWKMTHAVVLLK